MSKERNIYPDFSSELPPQPLSDAEIHSRLTTELSHWRLIVSPRPDNPNKMRQELYREFNFAAFEAVIDFLNAIKPVCDILPHHPRMENVWATLDVYLSTWAIDYNISYKDIQLAKNLDKIYAEKFERPARPKKRKAQANQKFFAELVGEIGNDRLEHVIEKVTEFYLLNNERTEPEVFTLLKGQFRQYQRTIIAGTASTDERNRLRNQLRKDLLMYLKGEPNH